MIFKIKVKFFNTSKIIGTILREFWSEAGKPDPHLKGLWVMLIFVGEFLDPDDVHL